MMDPGPLSESQENFLVMSLSAGKFKAAEQAANYRLSQDELSQLISRQLIMPLDSAGMSELTAQGKQEAQKINQRLTAMLHPRRQPRP